MLTVDFSAIGLKPGMRVLDAGCGSGRHLCEAFRTPGVDVTGADLNWVDLCKAKGILFLMAREKPGKWIVTNADIVHLPYAAASFDVVVCSEVLEHLPEGKAAVAELVRVLKPGGDLVVTVPRFFPERVCWALSAAYHHEAGGHVRIYKKGELMGLLEDAGTRCWRIRYRHGLHAPYWWLRCLVGHKNERSRPVRFYRRFLEWDILRHPPLTTMMDKILNPLIGKSIIFYLKKGYR
jgi:SAM-dependent methyltransferase